MFTPGAAPLNHNELSGDTMDSNLELTSSEDGKGVTGDSKHVVTVESMLKRFDTIMLCMDPPPDVVQLKLFDLALQLCIMSFRLRGVQTLHGLAKQHSDTVVVIRTMQQHVNDEILKQSSILMDRAIDLEGVERSYDDLPMHPGQDFDISDAVVSAFNDVDGGVSGDTEGDPA